MQHKTNNKIYTAWLTKLILIFALHVALAKVNALKKQFQKVKLILSILIYASNVVLAQMCALVKLFIWNNLSKIRTKRRELSRLFYAYINLL